MFVKQVTSGTTMTLTVSGVLDYNTVHIFKEQVEELKKHLDKWSDLQAVKLDFSQTEFIDSTGIGAVLEAVRVGSEKNIRVLFQGMNKVVKDTFETVGVFQIVEALQGRKT